MKKRTEFDLALTNAVRHGWKTPPSNPPCGEAAWMNFWRQCEAYEKDPNAGRPVVLHRSA